MIRYVFNDDEPLRIKAAAVADPQAMGERIQRLTEKAGGRFNVEAGVEDARDPSSPFHAHLTWDDKLAAHKHRCDQMRQIVRIIRVVDEKAEGGNTRAFLSINQEKGGRAYHPVGAVKKSEDLQVALLRNAERDLEVFQTRYRQLRDICELVEVARKKISARRSKIETRVA